METVYGFFLHPVIVSSSYFVLYVLANAVLLFAMGRFILKAPQAAFSRSIIVSFVATIIQIAAIILLVSILHGVDSVPLTPLISIVFTASVSCGIVGKMFCLSYGKAVFAWLPLFICQLVLMSFLLSQTDRAREPVKRVVCQTRLRGLGVAMEMYHVDYEAYPASPNEFVEGGYASSKNFYCPSDTQKREMSYCYLPPLETDSDETFVMCDLKGNHEDYRNVLIKKGAVLDFVEEEFQAELKKPYNARFAEAFKKAEGP